MERKNFYFTFLHTSRVPDSQHFLLFTNPKTVLQMDRLPCELQIVILQNLKYRNVGKLFVVSQHWNMLGLEVFKRLKWVKGSATFSKNILQEARGLKLSRYFLFPHTVLNVVRLDMVEVVHDNLFQTYLMASPNLHTLKVTPFGLSLFPIPPNRIGKLCLRGRPYSVPLQNWDLQKFPFLKLLKWKPSAAHNYELLFPASLETIIAKFEHGKYNESQEFLFQVSKIWNSYTTDFRVTAQHAIFTIRRS